LSLAQLNDPFLQEAVSVTPTVSTLSGVLPVEHSFCTFLAPGSDPLLEISSLDIFNGLPADIIGNGDLTPLEVFSTLTNVDLLGFLNALSTTLRRVSTGLDLPDGIPFVSDALSSLVDVGSMVSDLIDELTQGNDLFFQNLGQMLERLQDALGVTRDQLNLRCEEATNSILLDLPLRREFNVPVPLDFGRSLGPLSIAAGFESELFAIVDAQLTLGFDFNASDLTPAQYLATPLDNLNGNTGVGTVAGDDLEVVLPIAHFSFADVPGEVFSFMPPSPDNDLYKEQLDQKLLSAEVQQAFTDAGHSLTPSASIKVISFDERWRIRDGNMLYEIEADGPDTLKVTVSDVVPVDLDMLAAGATVQDAFNLIGTATSNAVAVTVYSDPDTGLVTGITLDYGAIPANVAPVFAIQAINSSPAAGDLGIVGKDTNGDGTLLGAVNTRSLRDRFFISEDSSIRLVGGLSAEAIELSASFGGLGLAIENGRFDLSIESGLSMVDPGTGVNDDGRVTLSEIFDNGVLDVIEIQTPLVLGNGRFPLVGQSEGFDVNAILNIDPNHPYTEAENTVQPIPIEDGPEVHVVITSNPFDIEITTNEHFDQIIDGFQHFSVDSICDGVGQIIELLRDADIAIFNTEIPLLNRSINDLLEADSLLQTLVDVLCVDPGALKTAVQDLVTTQLTQATEPLGAIPALFPQLNAQQRQRLTELNDALVFALGQEGPQLADIPSLLTGVVSGFRSFMDSLPNSINTGQLASVIDQIDQLLPSAGRSSRRSRTRWGWIRTISRSNSRMRTAT
jgi:hypothetical protein